jgi:hypothetical protein
MRQLGVTRSNPALQSPPTAGGVFELIANKPSDSTILRKRLKSENSTLAFCTSAISSPIVMNLDRTHQP